MTYSFTEKKRIRNNFGTRESILKEPDLFLFRLIHLILLFKKGKLKRKMLVYILYLNRYFQSQR